MLLLQRMGHVRWYIRHHHYCCCCCCCC
jgi:hypothetical protein